MPAKITKQKFKNSRVVLPGENCLILFLHFVFMSEGAK